jgi:hypothetical protein
MKKARKPQGKRRGKTGISLRALARALKVTLAAAQTARDSQRITPNPDGSWDLKRNRAEWLANTDPAKRSHGDPDLGAGDDEGKGSASRGLQASRRVGVDVKNRLLELELREKLGELIDRKEWIRIATATSRRTMDKLRAWGARLGPELVGIVDPMEMQRKIDAEVEVLCEELAQYPPSRNGDGHE